MTEAERARAWRKAQGFTLKQLAEITGFNMRSIQAYEAGIQASGEPVQEEAMLRYRLACAAVHHGHHKYFDWPV